jgi:hypothetical protein
MDLMAQGFLKNGIKCLLPSEGRDAVVMHLALFSLLNPEEANAGVTSFQIGIFTELWGNSDNF